jgi:hypothetical protein
VDQIDYPLKGLDRGPWKNAVAEVEDMPRSRASPSQYIDDPLFHHGPRSQTDHGVEVPLYACVLADPVPCCIQRDSPIDTYHVTARQAHHRHELAGTQAEVDGGHPQAGDPLE